MQKLLWIADLRLKDIKAL